MRHPAGEMEEDLDVLPRGMEDLEHGFIGHQCVERLEIDVCRLGIDDRLAAFAGNLDEAEIRPEGLLAHEFGVDRDIGFAGEFLDERLEG